METNVENVNESCRAFFVEMKTDAGHGNIYKDYLDSFHAELFKLLSDGWVIQLQQIIPVRPHPYLYVVVMNMHRTDETAFNRSIIEYQQI